MPLLAWSMFTQIQHGVYVYSDRASEHSLVLRDDEPCSASYSRHSTDMVLDKTEDLVTFFMRYPHVIDEGRISFQYDAHEFHALTDLMLTYACHVVITLIFITASCHSLLDLSARRSGTLRWDRKRFFCHAFSGRHSIY